MSIIGQQVFAAPGQVFSTISGGGGGGGGGIMSSIVNGPQSVVCGPSDIAINSGNNVNINGLAISLNGSSWSKNPNIFSTIALECSSINGQPVGGAVGPVLTLSTLNVSTIVGNTGIISMDPAGADSIRLGGLGPPGDITLAPSGGGVVNLSAVTNIAPNLNVSGSAFVGTSISSSVGIMNSLGNVAQIQPAISTIGFFPAVSTATTSQILMSLEGTTAALGVAAGNDTDGFGITANNGSVQLVGGGGNVQMTGISSINGWSPYVKTGYVSNLASGSQVLFSTPYNTDNIVVMLTATDANTTGGANPNISLLNSFGNNGVSSIGFATDTRNGGVGYAASFYWMAMPRSE